MVINYTEAKKTYAVVLKTILESTTSIGFQLHFTNVWLCDMLKQKRDHPLSRFHM